MFLGKPNRVYIVDKTENNPTPINGHPAWAAGKFIVVTVSVAFGRSFRPSSFRVLNRLEPSTTYGRRYKLLLRSACFPSFLNTHLFLIIIVSVLFLHTTRYHYTGRKRTGQRHLGQRRREPGRHLRRSRCCQSDGRRALRRSRRRSIVSTNSHQAVIPILTHGFFIPAFSVHLSFLACACVFVVNYACASDSEFGFPSVPFGNFVVVVVVAVNDADFGTLFDFSQ